MSSTFFGLNIGTSGLFASQTSLNVTANNISNERTEGYTRQVSSQRQSQALRTYTSSGTLGSGVEVYEISQIRDSYYDVKFWNNNCKMNEYSTKENYDKQVENFINEVNVEGFSKEFSAIYASLEELKNDPSDLTVRNQLLNNLSSVSDYINNIVGELVKIKTEVNTEISNAVDSINSLTDQIATLTKQINIIELEGSHANELRDKRSLLLDELSGFMHIDVEERNFDNGKSELEVKAGGFSLVNSYEHNEMVIKTDDEGNYYSYVFYDPVSGNATEFDPVSMNLQGSLKALYELRDGNNSVDSYRIKETVDSSRFNFETDRFVLGDGKASNFQMEKQSFLKILNADGTYGEKSYYAATYSKDDIGAYEPAPGEIHFIFDTGEYVFGSDIANEIKAAKGATGKLEISYTVEGHNEVLTEGAKGLGILDNLQIVEEEAIAYKGIKYYIKELQSLKMCLMREFNSVHHQGIDLNGNSTLNVDVLKMDNGDNLFVNQDLLNDQTLFATSTHMPQDGVSDFDLVLLMQRIETNPVFKGSTCTQFLENLTTEVAMDVQKVMSRNTTYDSMVKTIKNQRLSVSGVDSDEETSNLIKYQEAYNLSAKVIQIMSEVLDKLINETGV